MAQNVKVHWVVEELVKHSSIDLTTLLSNNLKREFAVLSEMTPADEAVNTLKASFDRDTKLAWRRFVDGF